MQPLEIAVLLVSLVWLVRATARPESRSIPLQWVAGGIVLGQVLLEVPRWQMAPAWALLAWLAVSSLRGARSGAPFRLARLVVGLGLLASALYLGLQLPVLALPPPAGPHLVGMTAYTLVDESRPETRTADPDDVRELFVEAWYPAAAPASLPDPRPLWSELYRGEWDRVSLLMGYLRGVDTHSYPDLPADAAGGPYPVVLFNHGLQMFTSQNTLLMEHLASHGYVVVSVGHPHDSIRVRVERAGTVIPAFIRSFEEFQAAVAWIEEASRPVREAVAALQTVEDPEQRAAIMREATRGSAVNETVALWVEDSRFALDHLASPDAASLPFAPVLDLSRLGAVGMSVGGAASAELCKVDARCDAGVDIDGLYYGQRQEDPLEVPFLMLSSDEGAGVNDTLRLSATRDYHEAHLLGSRHSDLTDLALVWPILRSAGQAGSVPGERCLAILNDVVLAFLDRYLAGEPGEGPSFPELERRFWPARAGASDAPESP